QSREQRGGEPISPRPACFIRKGEACSIPEQRKRDLDEGAEKRPRWPSVRRLRYYVAARPLVLPGSVGGVRTATACLPSPRRGHARWRREFHSPCMGRNLHAQSCMKASRAVNTNGPAGAQPASAAERG